MALRNLFPALSRAIGRVNPLLRYKGDGSVVNIQPGTQISTHDNNANAMLAQHKGTLNFDGATITTHGDQSHKGLTSPSKAA